MAQKKYIPIIDYLKAFAIVLVVTTHFFTYKDKDFALFIYVIQMGMPLFMFISSYNFAMSAERHGLNTLSALYAPAQMKKHFGGILPAYTLLFVVELAANLWLGKGYSLGDLLYAYISGGLNGGSHGGYFFCIYWQFLLFAPLLYLLLRRWPEQTLLAALALDMLYEFAVGALDIPRALNRLLFIRYLFIAVFGLYFYLWRSRVRLWMVALGAVFSLGYITALEYFGLDWPLTTYWLNTNVYASFYYIAVAVFAFHFFEQKQLPGKLHMLVRTIGCSTWQIYLFQMLFFRLHWSAPLGELPLFLKVLIGDAFCVAVGCLWSALESRMRKKMKKS
mgnify:FL=1